MGPSKKRRDDALDLRRQYRAEQARLAEEARRRAEEARRKNQAKKGGKK